MKDTPIIVQDPAILGGKPIVRGTRLSVEFILDLLAAGTSVDEIVREYPSLSAEGVREAVAYAAADMRRTDTSFVQLSQRQPV